MPPIIVTQGQQAQLTIYISNHQYATGYLYVKSLVDNQIQLTTNSNALSSLQTLSNWLNNAASINANDGSFKSEFVRGATQAYGFYVNKPVTDAQFQIVSDKLGDRVLNRVLKDGIPDANTVINEDVSSALGLPPDGFGFPNTSGWAGTAGDIAPVSLGGLGRDFVQVPYGTSLMNYIVNLSTVGSSNAWGGARAAGASLASGICGLVTTNGVVTDTSGFASAVANLVCRNPAANADASLVTNPITPPSGLGTTRDSTAYITSNGSNSATLGTGGTISDLVLVQTRAGNNITAADVLACNPGITNVNNIPAGTTLYIPQKQSDGSTTYHYAGGASINNNTVNGEYHMIVPDGNGGSTTYSRIADDFGYTIKETQVNAQGIDVYAFVGRQETLSSDIKTTSVTTQSDTNADGKTDSITIGADSDKSGTISSDETVTTGSNSNQNTESESWLREQLADGVITQAEYNDFVSIDTKGSFIGTVTQTAPVWIPTGGYDGKHAFFESSSTGAPIDRLTVIMRTGMIDGNYGSVFANITGNKLDNTITGNSLANQLDGGTGADTLIGQGGNDTYYVENSGDQVIEQVGEGLDTVKSKISYTLTANVENLSLLDFGSFEDGIVDGKKVKVYGSPAAFELDYQQGNAISGYWGTCGLVAIANLCTEAQLPVSEADVVQYAINNNLCTTTATTTDSTVLGSSNSVNQAAILTHYGVRNEILRGYNEQAIANLVQSGRGVLLAVNGGKLWGDRFSNNPSYDYGVVDHVITVTGAVYDANTNALTGFYIADSGPGNVGDMARYMTTAQLRAAARVSLAYTIYTVEPIKYWAEDLNGTGNALDNVIKGNRGDNVLKGGDGNDTLEGGGGRVHWHGYGQSHSPRCAGENPYGRARQAPWNARRNPSLRGLRPMKAVTPQAPTSR